MLQGKLLPWGEVIEMFCILIRGVVSQVYAFIKTHWIVHLKPVHFTPFNFSLKNKKPSPSWCGSGGWSIVPRPKGCTFDSPSKPIPRWQDCSPSRQGCEPMWCLVGHIGSLVPACREATNQCFSLASVFLSLSRSNGKKCPWMRREREREREREKERERQIAHLALRCKWSEPLALTSAPLAGPATWPLRHSGSDVAAAALSSSCPRWPHNLFLFFCYYCQNTQGLALLFFKPF